MAYDKLIKTKEDYDIAMKRIDELFHLLFHENLRRLLC